jgi:hypothetical protein
MILSNLSVPLVALVDSAVIGHLPHAQQLAAVAIGGSLYTLLTWAVGFLRMGTTGFAAQAAGRQDGSALRQVLLQGLLLGGLLALALILLALPFSAAALSLMQPSAQLDALARGYLQIRLFGLPAALASYALIGWLLGTQNARGPLAILLTTNLLNVALDLLFVLGLHWGVAGAAWAAKPVVPMRRKPTAQVSKVYRLPPIATAASCWAWGRWPITALSTSATSGTDRLDRIIGAARAQTRLWVGACCQASSSADMATPGKRRL